MRMSVFPQTIQAPQNENCTGTLAVASNYVIDRYWYV